MSFDPDVSLDKLQNLGFFDAEDVRNAYKTFLEKGDITPSGCRCAANPKAYLYCGFPGCEFARGGEGTTELKDLKEVAKAK
jgi:hypothetical protein